jgi:hypothetical protein
VTPLENARVVCDHTVDPRVEDACQRRLAVDGPREHGDASLMGAADGCRRDDPVVEQGNRSTSPLE